MKKIISWSLLLIILLSSCSSSPTGDPQKDGQAISNLIKQGRFQEADRLSEETVQFYFSNYSGPIAKEKIAELTGHLQNPVFASSLK